MIASTTITAVIDNIVSFFLSFFLSQMITHNMVMMLLQCCEEKNNELKSEPQMIALMLDGAQKPPCYNWSCQIS